MKEWYLLTSDSRPNSIGGYENDAFVDYKDDSFQEALSTDIAKTAILFNHDLSESQTIRCIIQDNTASTQLKSLERTVLATIGTLKAGMYIFFENRYWIITGYPGNNGIYEKATMILCQHKLRWQDNTGKIIERWANYTSASKYDVGENGNEVIILSSNNFTIWIPDDDDSATLDGKRVFIDRNTKKPTKVFKVTRSDDVLYLFGEDHGGILSFIADRDEINYITDNQALGICDYTPPHSTSLPPGTGEDQNISCDILGNPSIKISIPRIYTVAFFDGNGCDVDYKNINFTWDILCNFKVEQKIIDNTIELVVSDERSIGTSILLSVIVDDEVICEKEIKITDIL